MMNTSTTPKTLSDRLWNTQVSPQSYATGSDLYMSHVLEQYKLCVEATQQVSSWRGQTNAFFLTVQTVLLTAVALVYQPGWHFEPRWLVVLPVTAAILMCWYWRRLVMSYRQLNRAKFRIIEEYEKRLPTAPFVEAEWLGELAEGKDPKKYTELTSIEMNVPLVFAILYIVGAVGITVF